MKVVPATSRGTSISTLGTNYYNHLNELIKEEGVIDV